MCSKKFTGLLLKLLNVHVSSFVLTGSIGANQLSGMAAILNQNVTTSVAKPLTASPAVNQTVSANSSGFLTTIRNVTPPTVQAAGTLPTNQATGQATTPLLTNIVLKTTPPQTPTNQNTATVSSLSLR